MFKNAKHAAHLAHIAWILTRHDALFGLEAIGAPSSILWCCRRFAKPRKNSRKGERLAEALVALGPTFIKMGQALSTRADLVGEDVATDLSHLQDRLPPFDTATARATIEEELGASIDTLFQSFDDAPIAAASIAQVHFATTSEGKEVAVKVLRPDIEQKFSKDADMMRWLARIIERKKPVWRKKFKPLEVVETFAKTVHTELDLRFEAAAAEELKHNTRSDADFYVPRVFWQLSARRVLTTERITGFHAADAEGMKNAGLDTNTITKKAAEAFFNQVFRDGFFHADMHPGNLFVLPDGRLAPVDFGIMGRIDYQSQIYLAEILWGFLKEDYMHVARVHREAGYIPSHIDLGAFAQACMAVGRPIMNKPLNEISVGKLLGQLILIADNFEMQVQPHLLLLQKTMVTAEGVGRGLTPDINMWQLSEPLIMQWAKEHLSPRAKLKHYAKEALEVIREAPAVLRELRELMNELKDKKH